MSSDRDNLAREMCEAATWAGCWEEISAETRAAWLKAADIALAYAEKRVAEAVERVDKLRVAYEITATDRTWNKALRFALRALSSAEEVGP